MSNDEERTCDDMWKDSLPASETPTCPGGNIEQRIVEALTTLEEICKTTMDEGSESDRRFLGLCIDRLCADPCQTAKYPNGEELADPKTIYRLLRLLVKTPRSEHIDRSKYHTF